MHFSYSILYIYGFKVFLNIRISQLLLEVIHVCLKSIKNTLHYLETGKKSNLFRFTLLLLQSRFRRIQLCSKPKTLLYWQTLLVVVVVLDIWYVCIGEGNGNPLPVFLPGESQGRGSLVGCRLWGRTESDTTEATQQQQQQHVLSLLVTAFQMTVSSCVLEDSIFNIHCLPRDKMQTGKPS